MRFIIWGINYAPEMTGISPYNVKLANFLHARGHDVRMLTTFPYYPAWKKRESDRGRLYRTDFIEGVEVQRCWHYVPGKVNAVKRMVHEGTFVLTSFLRLLGQARADLLIVVSPPLLLGAAAWLADKLRGMPFTVHVQDLQPDAAVELAMLPPGRLVRALYRLEKFNYEKAALVSGISAGMMEAFRAKGVAERKLLFFPNPVVLPDPSTLPERGGFRRRYGFSPTSFLAVYSGNLGVKQGTEILVEAAEHLRGADIQIVICGDGAQKPQLEALASARGMDHVRLLPLLETAHYHEMLIDADVCVITQQRGSGKAFFPSKLLMTLAFARPVLAVADAGSELGRAIAQGGFGLNVQPGDARNVADALQELQGNPARRAEFGAAGRRYVSRYEETAVLTAVENAYTALVRRS